MNKSALTSQSEWDKLDPNTPCYILCALPLEFGGETQAYALYSQEAKASEIIMTTFINGWYPRRVIWAVYRDNPAVQKIGHDSYILVEYTGDWVKDELIQYFDETLQPKVSKPL